MKVWEQLGFVTSLVHENGPEWVLEKKEGLLGEDLIKAQIGMLERQRVRGLVPFRQENRDGTILLRYRITGLRPLTTSWRDDRKEERAWLSFLIGLQLVIKECELYLIRESELVLYPDTIWIGDDIRDIRLLPVPLRNFGTPEHAWRQWAALYQWLLSHGLPEDAATALAPKQWSPETFSHQLWIERLKEWSGVPATDQLSWGEDAASERPAAATAQQSTSLKERLHKTSENSVIGRTIISRDDGETMRFSAQSVHRQEWTRLLLCFVCWIAFALLPNLYTLLAALAGNIPLGIILWQRYRGDTLPGVYKSEEEAAGAAIEQAVMKAEPDAGFYTPATACVGAGMASIADRTVLLRSPELTVALSRQHPAAVIQQRQARMRLEYAEERAANVEFVCIQDKPIRLGRGPEGVDHFLDIPAVSRQHIEFCLEGSVLYAMDLGSLNGSFLNDQPLTPLERQVVQEGDTVSLPGVKISFKIDD